MRKCSAVPSAEAPSAEGFERILYEMQEALHTAQKTARITFR